LLLSSLQFTHDQLFDANFVSFGEAGQFDEGGLRENEVGEDDLAGVGEECRESNDALGEAN